MKVKNSSAIPLRAAYLHGPYTLYAAAYPSTFDPNVKHERHDVEGDPDFEPLLKAGGHWTTKLTVPEDIRETSGAGSRRSLEGQPTKSFTWIIEVASQVLFSNTASVHYEILIGRDERSIELGFHGAAASALSPAGKLEDHQNSSRHNVAQAKGVYSKAVSVRVEDTECLWNTPAFPSFSGDKRDAGQADTADIQEAHLQDTDHKTNEAPRKPAKRKRIHLVMLTHGLHSNVGADMLYIKESIDATAREAREAARKVRAEQAAKQSGKKATGEEDEEDGPRSKSVPEILVAPTQEEEAEEAEDEEEVLVRGFSGNTVRTERGIQYLGKRLAKYVLSITYPDQPYLPKKSSISKSITRSFTGFNNKDKDKSKESQPTRKPSHKGSSVLRDDEHRRDDLPYQITNISFIGHSLGGLVQTYAIAYINKHSPEFFDLIKPINFIALATPFLGLSNENAIYVKFALDFGLVGRTGQDLGLTWRAPTAVRSGWSAMIGGLGGKEGQKSNNNQPDPSTKPLLRILPTGPAHTALKKFRNRTVYSNVVNDGIVPLRTSCLLFLDWSGLERVEKARREMGLVGTMAGWGWAELTGQNASSPRAKSFWTDIFSDNEDSDSSRNEPARKHGEDVPQPAEEATKEDNIKNSESMPNPSENQFLKNPFQNESDKPSKPSDPSSRKPSGPWTDFISMFKPNEQKPQKRSSKQAKILQRGQTMKLDEESGTSTPSEESQATSRVRPVRGSSLYTNQSTQDGLEAPPQTTFFEAAGDLLNPPLPPKEFLINPAARPRTIFHDRVYHPEDIPPPPVKKQQKAATARPSQGSDNNESVSPQENVDTKQAPAEGPIGSMKVEEKIARAYHHELSWRKVLVRLEPDAHNNMIVRRMFANAYGWPVVKHICDTHFAYTAAARTKDEKESNEDRVQARDGPIGSEGEAVRGQHDPPSASEEPTRRNTADDRSPSRQKKLGPERLTPRTTSEIREQDDELTALKSPGSLSVAGSFLGTSLHSSGDSAKWSDRYFECTDDDSDTDIIDPARAKQIPVQSSSPRVADTLSSSPQEERDLGILSRERGQDADGDNADTEFGHPTTTVAGLGIVDPSDRLQTASGPPGTASHMGVSEQVAFAQSKRHEHKEQDSGK